MKTILVSLISDQPIPTLQFIKEKEAVKHIFISTSAMESKGVADWIITSAKINIDNVFKIIVDPFSYSDVYEKVKGELRNDILYTVNLTGGTKIMTLAVNDALRKVNSHIFYLLGNTNYIQIYPNYDSRPFKLKANLNLNEYIEANGFNIKNNTLPKFDANSSQKVFDYFLHSFERELDFTILEDLRTNHRGKKIVDINKIANLSSFLTRIGYTPLNESVLEKHEIKFLTGDWLEEFIFYKLWDVHGRLNDCIGTGWVISKNNISNEFDILFLINDTLRIIECKTSIWKDINEKENIIAETIYKADSLKSKFGLFAKTSIITMSDLNSPKLLNQINRASENGIKVFGRAEMLNLDLTIDELLQ